MARFEIVLLNESDSDNKSPISGSQNTMTDSKSKTAVKQTAIKGLVVYNVVKPFIKQTVQHQINTVELRTGSAELQQQIEFGQQVVGDVFSVISGAATGAAVGGVPGAIIGALASVASIAIRYSQNADTIHLQGNLEDISISMMNRRAGGAVASYSKSREGRQ